MKFIPKLFSENKNSTLISFFFLLIFYSCNQEVDPATKIFEYNLPENDLIVLNNWISFYDEIVLDKYKDEGKSIDDFLLDIAKGHTSKWNLESNKICDLIQQFNKSTLEYRSQNVEYDTMFTVLGKKTWGFSNENDTIIAAIMKNKDTAWIDGMIIGYGTVKERIEYEKEKGYEETVSKSSFIDALEKVNTKDSTILNYIYERKLTGISNPSILAAGAIEYKLSKRKGLVKRILVFAVFINYINLNFKC